MSTTLRDVAEAAGVSVMSACAVLTGGGRNVKVSEERARVIREKARELNYEPNLSARTLRTKRTDTIGVVLQNLTSFGEEPYYYQQLLDGIMLALFPRGYTLALSPTLIQPDGEVRIAHGRFDGVLWCSPDLIESSIETIKNLRTPVVMVHAPPEAALGMATFAADNDRAMERIVGHLAELGHTSIGFVVKPHTAQSVEGKARSAAFLKAAQKLGVDGEVLQWEYDCAELAITAKHTALAAFNDVHAGHILTRAKELGIRVPQDLSVVGFDSSSFCERTVPKLTSVHQPVQQMASRATECLLNLINSGPNQTTTLYDCPLDIRESTAHVNPKWRN